MANCKCLWSQFMEFRCNKKVIRQKCESQNRCFEKTKQAKFSEKRKFLSPWYALVSWFLWRRCTRVAVNMQFENFKVFFLSTSDARKHILSTIADSVFFIHETFLRLHRPILQVRSAYWNNYLLYSLLLKLLKSKKNCFWKI